MDREHVLRQINAIFENCKQHMENTEADWEKAYGCFFKAFKRYDSDPWVNQQIQKAILKLEDFIREKERKL